MELFNLQDLITEETASLDFVYLLPDMDGYLCILGHSGCQSNSFRQLTSGLISSIADACQHWDFLSTQVLEQLSRIFGT